MKEKKAKVNLAVFKAFRCGRLSGTLSYNTCILRQVRTTEHGNPRYPECYGCKQGEEIRAKFKGVAA